MTLSNIPATQTLTIAAVSGNTVQFTSPVNGGANDWSGGIMEVTVSSTAKRTRSVILVNGVDTVTVSSPFNHNKLPTPGDTVVLSGGPLAQAQIYSYEPDSIQAAIDRGKKFFVVASCVAGDVVQTGFGGHASRGGSNKKADYQFEVAAETPDTTGTDTADDAYRVSVDLPTLKEQCIVLIHWFRMQTALSLYGDGPISFIYASYQRTGSPLRLRGAIISFNLRVK